MAIRNLDNDVTFGALPSPPSDDDLIYEHMSAAQDGCYLLPEEFSLRSFAPACRYQGSRGTCSAFAASAIGEIHHYDENNPSPHFSPEFIYFHRTNKPSQGMFGRDVFRILRDIGSVPESLFPYRLKTNGSASDPLPRRVSSGGVTESASSGECMNVADDYAEDINTTGDNPVIEIPSIVSDSEPLPIIERASKRSHTESKSRNRKVGRSPSHRELISPELYEIAAKYKIQAFVRITSVDGLKRALIEIGPCYISTRLFTRRPEFWKPSYVGERTSSGHAVAVVGYNVRGFVLRNSWGPAWEDEGHITLPYDEWCAVLECWAAMPGDFMDTPVGSPVYARKRT